MAGSRITDIGKGTSQERVARVEILSDGNHLALLQYSLAESERLINTTATSNKSILPLFHIQNACLPGSSFTFPVHRKKASGFSCAQA